MGLRMDGLWGERRADGFELAESVEELSGRYDLAIVSVKSYDTAAIAAALRPLVDDKGVVLSAQNGLGNLQTLADVFGADRTLGASILVGAELPEPGRVTVTVQAAPIVIGPLEVSDCVAMERVHRWISLLRAADVPCEPTARILGYVWGKVLYNAPLNALGALLEVPYGALAENPELRTIMDGVIDEIFAVARARGVELLWTSADEYRSWFYGHLVPSTYHHHGSMLQDFRQRRRTEIDAINGAVWRYGRETGVPTPYNEALTRLVREREKRFTQARPAGSAPPQEHA